MIKHKQHLDYVSPTTDVLVLHIETGILITSDPDNNPNKDYTIWALGDI